MTDAVDMLDVIEAKIAALQKDADRYQWLRDKHEAGHHQWFVYGAKSTNLDENIDDAMKEKNNG